jgi:hypothetical protein
MTQDDLLILRGMRLFIRLELLSEEMTAPRRVEDGKEEMGARRMTRRPRRILHRFCMGRACVKRGIRGKVSRTKI